MVKVREPAPALAFLSNRPGTFTFQKQQIYKEYRPLKSVDIQRAVLFTLGVLFGVLAAGACPVLCRVQEGSVAVSADILQRLLVFAVFVAWMVDKRLNGLAAVIFLAVPTGDMASGQAAFLHFTSGLAQFPGAVQVPRLAALAGFQILPAGPAVGTTAADFLCTIHREELPSK